MYLNGRCDDYLGTEPARATFAITLFLPLLATLSVATRIWARSIKRHKLVADDWVSVLTLVRRHTPAVSTAEHANLPSCSTTFKLLAFLSVGDIAPSLKRPQDSFRCRYLPRLIWTSC